jgi:hypothetical protein
MTGAVTLLLYTALHLVDAWLLGFGKGNLRAIPSESSL